MKNEVYKIIYLIRDVDDESWETAYTETEEKTQKVVRMLQETGCSDYRIYKYTNPENISERFKEA